MTNDRQQPSPSSEHPAAVSTDETPSSEQPGRAIFERHVRVKPWMLVAHIAVTVALGLLTILFALTPEPVRVEVDMFASTGTRAALYVNDLTVPPMTQRLVPGERRTYVLSGIVEDIRMLRLDPTDVTPATVDLHSIVVVGDRGILAQFGPTALAGWGTDALATKGADETGLHLQTTTPYPIITAWTAIPVDRKTGRLTRWLPLVNRSDIQWQIAAASLILVLLAACLDSPRRLHLPIAAMAAGLAVAVSAAEVYLGDGPESAAVAVSRATVMGQSGRPALIGSARLFIGAVSIGALAATIRRRRATPPIDVVGGGQPKRGTSLLA